MSYKDSLCTTFIFKGKSRRQYGDEAPSKLVPAEKGRSPIYIMSDGALEQEEVDYLVEASQYKQDEQMKRKVKSKTKQELERVATEISKAPKGKRAKKGREILGG
tara:strand:+ start:360 stop:674 length:315 start_codon:yes stop_codon:yes gene_type:complete